MRRVLESVTEEWFRSEVRRYGAYAIKWLPVIAGIPDRIVLAPGGRVFFVELKREGEKPSAVQRVWHARFAALGHNVVVLDSRRACELWIVQTLRPLSPNR